MTCLEVAEGVCEVKHLAALAQLANEQILAVGSLGVWARRDDNRKMGRTSIELILGYTTEERELLPGLVCGCAEPRRTRPFRLVDQLCAEELVEGVRDRRR